MIYAFYVAIGLFIFYAGFFVGREEMRYHLGRKVDRYYDQKRAEQSRRHITQPPNHAHYDTNYHDIHNTAYRARIFPN